ncbi:unnamed protein product [Albugo candida]|uniref:Uncharacterized protein n=1 Tax=Albugo candida TaxID=65357 RepID=A0A024FVY2_9STRA|nr:unnamed protein product [Albugo candida]|eukprot:CCI10824.1 unnamed protein product [Albugo candida]
MTYWRDQSSLLSSIFDCIITLPVELSQRPLAKVFSKVSSSCTCCQELTYLSTSGSEHIDRIIAISSCSRSSLDIFARLSRSNRIICTDKIMFRKLNAYYRYEAFVDKTKVNLRQSSCSAYVTPPQGTINKIFSWWRKSSRRYSEIVEDSIWSSNIQLHIRESTRKLKHTATKVHDASNKELPRKLIVRNYSTFSSLLRLTPKVRVPMIASLFTKCGLCVNLLCAENHIKLFHKYRMYNGFVRRITHYFSDYITVHFRISPTCCSFASIQPFNVTTFPLGQNSSHDGSKNFTLVAAGGNRNQRGLMVQIAESKVGEHLMAFSINNLETATSIFNRCFPDTKIKGEKRKLNPYKYKIIHPVVIRGYSMR